MTRLSEANSSNEIGLSRYFRKRTDKKDLLVLVEGDDDVFFWKKVMEYANKRYAHIDVHTLKLPDAEQNGNETDRKGKTCLMEDVHDLGPSKVVAVDRDYDNLIYGYHSYSSRIGNDPCVLHTIYYAMENHKLYPDIVKNYLTRGLQEETDFDFENRMNDFSRTIAPYLLLLIVIERKRALNALSESEQNRMTIKEFRSDIATFKVNKNNFTDEATNWKNRMNDKYGDLIILLGTEIQNLKEELATRGYTENEYWKLLQGHSLAGYMLRTMTCIADETMKKKEKELINNLTDRNQAYEKINEYRHRLGMRTPHMHDFINFLFTEEPLLSDNDPGIGLIHQQIDNIPE